MKCVICIRNPLDVAASQVKWNRDLSGSYYMDLWLNYTTSALKNTAGKTRLFVFYEDIMEDWRRELQRLAAYLGNQDTVVQPGIASAVDEFISQELQHYRTSVIDVIDEARLAFPTKALYVALRMYVGGQQMSASEQTPRNDWLQRALNLFGLYALQAQAESSILHRQNSEHEQSLIFSREQIVEKDQTISELTSQLAEHIEAFAAAQQRITEQVESNAALKARVIELNEAMPTLRNEVSEREQTILTQQTKLGEYEQTISAMQSKISEHERTISAAQLKISDCEQTLSSLQTGIRERDEIIMTLQTDIVTKINEAATLNARLVEKEQYWAEITRGRGWALLQLLWRIRFRIIPRGSRRERLLGLQ